MDYNMIVRPLVGAVIGYSTNWLAIKMLFRPYEEKKIGGFKVPFTPGVIPRERDRIARSLGGAVGEKLLTPEVISNELLNERVIDHIKTYVISDLLKEDLSLETMLEAVLKDMTPSVIRGFEQRIVNEIGLYMNQPGSKEAVRRQISDYLSSAVPYNTVIGEVVGERITEEISGLVRANAEPIGTYVVGLADNEQVKGRIAQAIETLVMEKVGALGAMFLDGPAMAESVVDYMKKLVAEDDVQSGIVSAVDDSLKMLRDRNLSETVSLGLYQETISAATEKVLDGMYSQLTEARLNDMAAPMVRKLIREKIHLTDVQKELIENQVENLYRHFIEKNISTFLEAFEVSKIVESEINQFSVSEIEALIFDIVDKELNAITWIGGLLGFLIGLVYVFI